MKLQQKLIDLYQHVCWLDVHSLKPGNVSIFANSKDLCVDDFLNSAKVSAGPITEQHDSLGSRILHATKATHQTVGTNTNLGIILLIAPLIHAVYVLDGLIPCEANELEEALKNVLFATTVNDAILVYQAIRLMNPGGMGEKNNQDIAEEPNVSLLKTMKIAKHWDQIAAQYSNNYKDVFNFGLPKFRSLKHRWQDEKWAVTGLFLGYLSTYEDSLIERKYGMLKAKEISDMIRKLEMELCRSDLPGGYEAQLLQIDSQLKRDLINPGTTADLTAASIFASGLVNEPAAKQ
ncbi:MAG: triphosphoribosyl-dephospho-CoA synthase [Pseudomonadota bacterium]